MRCGIQAVTALLIYGYDSDNGMTVVLLECLVNYVLLELETSPERNKGLSQKLYFMLVSHVLYPLLVQ